MGPWPRRGLGQEGAGGVVEADELLLVEIPGVDVLLELLDVLLADVVEGAAVLPLVLGVAHSRLLRRPRPERADRSRRLRSRAQPGGDAEGPGALQARLWPEQDHEGPR